MPFELNIGMWNKLNIKLIMIKLE